MLVTTQRVGEITLSKCQPLWEGLPAHQALRTGSLSVRSSGISLTPINWCVSNPLKLVTPFQHLSSFQYNALGISPRLNARASDLSSIRDSSIMFFLWALPFPGLHLFLVLLRSRAVSLNPFVKLFICYLFCECMFSHHGELMKAGDGTTSAAAEGAERSFCLGNLFSHSWPLGMLLNITVGLVGVHVAPLYNPTVSCLCFKPVNKSEKQHVEHMTRRDEVSECHWFCCGRKFSAKDTFRASWKQRQHFFVWIAMCLAQWQLVAFSSSRTKVLDDIRREIKPGASSGWRGSSSSRIREWTSTALLCSRSQASVAPVRWTLLVETLWLVLKKLTLISARSLKSTLSPTCMWWRILFQ